MTATLKPNPLAALITKYSEGAKAALDAGRNDLATEAYARGANAIRALARQPQYQRQQLEIDQVAAQFDMWAAQSNMPYVDPTFSDFPTVTGYEEDSYDGIPTEQDGVLSDLGESKFLPDGSPATELAADAQYAQLQAARRFAVQKPVQVCPVTAEGALLSNTVLVKYGASGSASGGSYTAGGANAGVAAFQEVEVVKWDGNGNGEALPCRVSISRLTGGQGATFPSGNDGAGNTFVYRPFAHIFWGTGERGQLNEAYCDVGRGIQFTISASHLYVNVGMDAPPTGAFLAGSMYLNGHGAFFAGQSQAPVQRTIYIDALTNASNSTFIVPLFATSLLPPMNSVFVGTYTLDFLDNNGNVISSLGPIAGGGIIEPIPLPDDVYQIKVTNNSGGTQNYRFPFLLSL